MYHILDVNVTTCVIQPSSLLIGYHDYWHRFILMISFCNAVLRRVKAQSLSCSGNQVLISNILFSFFFSLCRPELYNEVSLGWKVSKHVNKYLQGCRACDATNCKYRITSVLFMLPPSWYVSTRCCGAIKIDGQEKPSKSWNVFFPIFTHT